MGFNVEAKVSLLTILLFGVVVWLLLGGVICGRHDSGDGHDWDKIYDWLRCHDYTQAERVNKPKPDNLAPDIKQATTATAYGEGTWVPECTYTPEDTLPVELTTVALADGSFWGRVTIDGKEVTWQRLEYYREELERNWCAFLEVANCDSNPVGIGAGYRIWRPFDINVAPSLSINTELKWMSGQLRLSRNIWSGVSLGGDIGGRLMLETMDVEGHLSVSVGIEL